ncbi:Golgi transport complex subunit 4 [Malassezia sp. CBS 17886]|nr:Golgi transport complex subunit 4 [Malassezia sp. CBS 17886]
MSPVASADDARRALAALDDAQRVRDARMGEMMHDTRTRVAAGRAEVGATVRPAVASAAAATAALQRGFADTARVAGTLHADMVQLHEERRRVDAAMDWCRQAMQLKTACVMLAEALERHDWDACIQHFTEAQGVSTEVVRSEFAKRTVPSATLPGPVPQTLASMRAALVAAITAGFHRYTSPDTSNEAEATRYFSYFAAIGAYTEGLEAYSTFARALVAKQGEEVQGRLSVSPPPPNAYYGMVWGLLFENLAVFLSQHQPVVDRMFDAPGQPKFARGVLPSVSDAWTKLGTQILDVWGMARGKTRVIEQAGAYRFAGLAAIRAAPFTSNRVFVLSGDTDTSARVDRTLPFTLTRPNTPVVPAAPAQPAQGPDTHLVDVLLTELASIASQWVLFAQFLQRAMGLGPEQIDAMEPGPRGGGLGAQITALLSDVFVPLQMWALHVCIERAHELETIDLAARPVASSVPDDLFFMLRSLLVRTLAASDAAVVDTVLAGIVSLLESELVEVAVLRMDGCRRGVQIARLVDGPRRMAAAREVKATMMVYLNVLDVSAHYTEVLLADMVQPAFLEQYFAPAESTENASTPLAHVQDALGQHFGALVSKMRSSAQFEMEELFALLIEPRVRALVADMLREVNYMLDDAAYAQAAEANSAPKRLAGAWTTIMAGYRDQLTESNYVVLFQLVVDAIVGPWENAAMEMRFTELGALRFDKDVRAMLATLAEQTTWGVRDRFARLQQIAFVLNVDDDDGPVDIYETGSSLGISWQLTPNEVAGARARRA